MVQCLIKFVIRLLSLMLRWWCVSFAAETLFYCQYFLLLLHHHHLATSTKIAKTSFVLVDGTWFSLVSTRKHIGYRNFFFINCFIVLLLLILFIYIYWLVCLFIYFFFFFRSVHLRRMNSLSNVCRSVQNPHIDKLADLHRQTSIIVWLSISSGKCYLDFVRSQHTAP